MRRPQLRRSTHPASADDENNLSENQVAQAEFFFERALMACGRLVHETITAAPTLSSAEACFEIRGAEFFRRRRQCRFPRLTRRKPAGWSQKPAGAPFAATSSGRRSRPPKLPRERNRERSIHQRDAHALSATPVRPRRPSKGPGC